MVESLFMEVYIFLFVHICMSLKISIMNDNSSFNCYGAVFKKIKTNKIIFCNISIR